MHILLHWRWSTVWNRPILGYTGHLTSLRIQGATASISHSQVKPRNQLLRTLETTHIWKLATCSYITGSQINNARKKEKEITRSHVEKSQKGEASEVGWIPGQGSYF